MFRFAGKHGSPIAKRRKYRSYSPTLLTNAYKDVLEKGLSVCKASKKYEVPEQTLRDRVKCKVEMDTTKSGPDPLFSQEEEARLVQHIKEMASIGYGYTRAEVMNLATDFAVQLKKRTTEKPLSLQWYYSFMSRWPELKLKRPKTLTNLRAMATSENAINNYFAELGSILEKYSLKNKPECIYNVDEKGVQLNHTPPSVVAPADVIPSAVTSERSHTTTVIGCGNALGHQIPPYLVFSGKRRREELMTGATPGADFDLTESGWSNSSVFQSYLENHFSRFAKGFDDDQHVLLLCDGHRSHITPYLIDWGIAHRVILFVLPPHTSHVLQPMDVGCFGPFERVYNNECHKHVRSHLGAVNRYSVCQLVCKAYTIALSPQNLRSAFKKSGVYPYDPSAVDKSVFVAATVLKQFEKEAEAHVDTHSDIATESDIETAETVKVGEVGEKGDCNSEEMSKSFFRNKRPVVKKVTQVVKQRRNISTVVGGKAITERDTAEKVKEFIRESATKVSKTAPFKPPFKSVPVKDKPTKPTSDKPTKCKTSKEMQCGSTESRIVDPPPVQGASGIHNTKYIISDSDSQTSDDNDEKCCVCNKFQPYQLRHSVSLVFTSWGQCMYEGCEHWTHLKYCCDVRVLRRHDIFYCPCHGLPCKPNEE